MFNHKPKNLLVKAVSILLIHTFLLSEISSAAQISRSTLAPEPATRAGSIDEAWIMASIRLFVAQILTVAHDKNLAYPELFIAPRIEQFMASKRVDPEALHERFDITNISVTRDGGRVVGIGLPVKTKGAVTYVDYYNLTGDGSPIESPLYGGRVSVARKNPGEMPLIGFSSSGGRASSGAARGTVNRHDDDPLILDRYPEFPGLGIHHMSDGLEAVAAAAASPEPSLQLTPASLPSDTGTIWVAPLLSAVPLNDDALATYEIIRGAMSAGESFADSATRDDRHSLKKEVMKGVSAKVRKYFNPGELYKVDSNIGTVTLNVLAKDMGEQAYLYKSPILMSHPVYGYVSLEYDKKKGEHHIYLVVAKKFLKEFNTKQSVITLMGRAIDAIFIDKVMQTSFDTDDLIPPSVPVKEKEEVRPSQPAATPDAAKADERKVPATVVPASTGQAVPKISDIRWSINPARLPVPCVTVNIIFQIEGHKEPSSIAILSQNEGDAPRFKYSSDIKDIAMDVLKALLHNGGEEGNKLRAGMLKEFDKTEEIEKGKPAVRPWKKFCEDHPEIVVVFREEPPKVKKPVPVPQTPPKPPDTTEPPMTIGLPKDESPKVGDKSSVADPSPQVTTDQNDPFVALAGALKSVRVDVSDLSKIRPVEGSAFGRVWAETKSVMRGFKGMPLDKLDAQCRDLRQNLDLGPADNKPGAMLDKLIKRIKDDPKSMNSLLSNTRSRVSGNASAFGGSSEISDERKKMIDSNSRSYALILEVARRSGAPAVVAAADEVFASMAPVSAGSGSSPVSAPGAGSAPGDRGAAGYYDKKPFTLGEPIKNTHATKGWGKVDASLVGAGPAIGNMHLYGEAGGGPAPVSTRGRRLTSWVVSAVRRLAARRALPATENRVEKGFEERFDFTNNSQMSTDLQRKVKDLFVNTNIIERTVHVLFDKIIIKEDIASIKFEYLGLGTFRTAYKAIIVSNEGAEFSFVLKIANWPGKKYDIHQILGRYLEPSRDVATMTTGIWKLDDNRMVLTEEFVDGDTYENIRHNLSVEQLKTLQSIIVEHSILFWKLMNGIFIEDPHRKQFVVTDRTALKVKIVDAGHVSLSAEVHYEVTNDGEIMLYGQDEVLVSDIDQVIAKTTPREIINRLILNIERSFDREDEQAIYGESGTKEDLLGREAIVRGVIAALGSDEAIDFLGEVKGLDPELDKWISAFEASPRAFFFSGKTMQGTDTPLSEAVRRVYEDISIGRTVGAFSNEKEISMLSGPELKDSLSIIINFFHKHLSISYEGFPPTSYPLELAEAINILFAVGNSEIVDCSLTAERRMEWAVKLQRRYFNKKAHRQVFSEMFRYNPILYARFMEMLLKRSPANDMAKIDMLSVYDKRLERGGEISRWQKLWWWGGVRSTVPTQDEIRDVVIPSYDRRAPQRSAREITKKDLAGKNTLYTYLYTMQRWLSREAEKMNSLPFVSGNFRALNALFNEKATVLETGKYDLKALYREVRVLHRFVIREMADIRRGIDTLTTDEVRGATPAFDEFYERIKRFGAYTMRTVAPNGDVKERSSVRNILATPGSAPGTVTPGYRMGSAFRMDEGGNPLDVTRHTSGWDRIDQGAEFLGTAPMAWKRFAHSGESTGLPTEGAVAKLERILPLSRTLHAKHTEPISSIGEIDRAINHLVRARGVYQYDTKPDGLRATIHRVFKLAEEERALFNLHVNYSIPQTRLRKLRAKIRNLYEELRGKKVKVETLNIIAYADDDLARLEETLGYVERLDTDKAIPAFKKKLEETAVRLVVFNLEGALSFSYEGVRGTTTKRIYDLLKSGIKVAVLADTEPGEIIRRLGLNMELLERDGLSKRLILAVRQGSNSKGDVLRKILDDTNIIANECVVFADRFERLGDDSSMPATVRNAVYANVGYLASESKRVYTISGGPDMVCEMIDFMLETANPTAGSAPGANAAPGYLAGEPYEGGVGMNGRERQTSGWGRIGEGAGLFESVPMARKYAHGGESTGLPTGELFPGLKPLAATRAPRSVWGRTPSRDIRLALSQVVTARKILNHGRLSVPEEISSAEGKLEQLHEKLKREKKITVREVREIRDIVRQAYNSVRPKHEGGLDHLAYADHTLSRLERLLGNVPRAASQASAVVSINQSLAVQEKRALIERLRAMDIKLVAFDLDDTLAKVLEDVSQEARKMIQDLLAAGIKVVIITGADSQNARKRLGISGPLPSGLILATSMGGEIEGIKSTPKMSMKINMKCFVEDTVRDAAGVFGLEREGNLADIDKVDYSIDIKDSAIAISFNKNVQPDTRRAIYEHIRSVMEASRNMLNVTMSSTAVDIAMATKGRVLVSILEELGIEHNKAVIFADQLGPGHNDRSMAEAVREAVFANVGPDLCDLKNVFNLGGGPAMTHEMMGEILEMRRNSVVTAAQAAESTSAARSSGQSLEILKPLPDLPAVTSGSKVRSPKGTSVREELRRVSGQLGVPIRIFRHWGTLVVDEEQQQELVSIRDRIVEYKKELESGSVLPSIKQIRNFREEIRRVFWKLYKKGLKYHAQNFIRYADISLARLEKKLIREAAATHEITGETSESKRGSATSVSGMTATDDKVCEAMQDISNFVLGKPGKPIGEVVVRLSGRSIMDRIAQKDPFKDLCAMAHSVGMLFFLSRPSEPKVVLLIASHYIELLDSWDERYTNEEIISALERDYDIKIMGADRKVIVDTLTTIRQKIKDVSARVSGYVDGFQYDSKRVDVNDIIKGALNRRSPNNTDFTVMDLPSYASGDRDLLEAAFGRFLHAQDDNGYVTSIEGRVRLTPDGSKVEIRMNCRLGVSREMVESIYDPTFYAHFKDIGGGLQEDYLITAEIIRFFGGTIRAVGDRNGNSEFIIELPLAISGEGKSADRTSAADSAAAAQAAKEPGVRSTDPGFGRESGGIDENARRAAIMSVLAEHPELATSPEELLKFLEAEHSGVLEVIPKDERPAHLQALLSRKKKVLEVLGSCPTLLDYVDVAKRSSLTKDEAKNILNALAGEGVVANISGWYMLRSQPGQKSPFEDKPEEVMGSEETMFDLAVRAWRFNFVNGVEWAFKERLIGNPGEEQHDRYRAEFSALREANAKDMRALGAEVWLDEWYSTASDYKEFDIEMYKNLIRREFKFVSDLKGFFERENGLKAALRDRQRALLANSDVDQGMITAIDVNIADVELMLGHFLTVMRPIVEAIEREEATATVTGAKLTATDAGSTSGAVAGADSAATAQAAEKSGAKSADPGFGRESGGIDEDTSLIVSAERTFDLKSTIDLKGREEYMSNLFAFGVNIFYRFSSRCEMGLEPEQALSCAKSGKDERITGDDSIYDFGEFERWDRSLAAISYLVTGEVLSEEELINRVKTDDKAIEYCLHYGPQVIFVISELVEQGKGSFTYEQLWHRFNEVLTESQQTSDDLEIHATLEFKDGSTMTLGPEDTVYMKPEKIPDYYSVMFNRALNLALGNVDLSKASHRVPNVPGSSATAQAMVTRETEEVCAGVLKDAIRLIKAKEVENAAASKETDRPIMVAFGTSWIKRYASGEEQHRVLNPLIAAVRNYCIDKKIPFVDNDDDKLLASIDKMKDSDVRLKNARVVVLAGSESVEKHIFDVLGTDKKDAVVVGIDGNNLVADEKEASYAYIVEVLTLALSEACGVPVAVSHGIKISQIAGNIYKIVLPPTNPMDYKKLEPIYKVQIAA